MMKLLIISVTYHMLQIRTSDTITLVTLNTINVVDDSSIPLLYYILDRVLTSSS